MSEKMSKKMEKKEEDELRDEESWPQGTDTMNSASACFSARVLIKNSNEENKLSVHFFLLS